MIFRVFGYFQIFEPVYTGENCELRIPCADVECQNEAFCMNTDEYTDFQCVCSEINTGRFCEHLMICEITPNVCRNGAGSRFE